MADKAEVLAAFGARVAELRKKRAMSQADLAAASRIDRVSISRIERGQQNVGVVSLASLAEALSCDAAELLRPPSSTATSE